MNHRLLLGSVVVVAAIGSGCANFTHFQTAKALEPGEVQFDTVYAYAPDLPAVDARARVGFGYGVDAGASIGMSGLVTGDIKFQFIEQDQGAEPDNRRSPKRNHHYKTPRLMRGPVNASVGIGGGIGYWSDFSWVQLTVSHKLQRGPEFYVSYRYQAMDIELDLGDPDDQDDADDTVLETLLEEEANGEISLHHVFFGMEVDLGRGWFMTPEFSVVFGDLDAVGDAGVAFGYRW